MPGMPPDLERVVQNMLNKGETEENIQSVITHYKQVHNVQKPDTYKGPTDWMGGFMNSLSNGEAMDAVNKSTSGYMSGLSDIPGNILSGVGDLASAQWNAMTDPNYIPDTIKSGIEALPSVPGRIRGALGDIGNTISHAGSDPEAFGRMDANLTATPLITEAAGTGLPKVIPSARTIGQGMQNVGDLMATHKPITGMVPHFADVRTLRGLEGWFGRKLSSLGENIGVPSRVGEIVSDAPDFNEGAIIDNTKRLPPSNTSFYGQDSYEPPPSNYSKGNYGPLPQEQLALPPSNTSFYMGDGGRIEPPAQIIGGYGNTLSDAINPSVDPLQAGGNVGASRMLPPASSPSTFANLPESSLDTSRFEPPAQIIGNQNSPVMPHGIPEETIPDTIKVPQKNLNPRMLNYAKKNGYTFIGYDGQGNLILKTPQIPGS